MYEIQKFMSVIENLDFISCSEFNLRRNISVEKCDKKVSGGYDPNTNQVIKGMLI